MGFNCSNLQPGVKASLLWIDDASSRYGLEFGYEVIQIDGMTGGVFRYLSISFINVECSHFRCIWTRTRTRIPVCVLQTRIAIGLL